MGIFDRPFNSNMEKIQANKDVKGLVEALKDKDSDVRSSAALALKKIKAKKSWWNR